MAQSPNFPDSFYRVVMKGLLVQDDKVLMTEDFGSSTAADRGGEWELPGGGLDFGENFQEGLMREIKEEMGLEVTKVADTPLYIWTAKRQNLRDMPWFYVLILAFPFEVKNLDFVPSEECRRIEFMSKDNMRANKAKITDQIHPFIELFDPKDFH